MCDFISWVEQDDGNVFFLTDEDIADPVVRERIEGSSGSDFIGHGAIRAAFKGIVGTNREETRFWEPERFPEKIRQYLTDPQTLLRTWGTILTHGLDVDGTISIGRTAPPKWRKCIIAHMIQKMSKDPHWAYCVLSNIRNLTETQRQLLIEGAVKDPEWAYYTVRVIWNLTEDQRQMLIEGVAKDSWWAYQALRHIPNLTEAQRQLLIEVVAKDPRLAYHVLYYNSSDFTGVQRALLMKTA